MQAFHCRGAGLLIAFVLHVCRGVDAPANYSMTSRVASPTLTATTLRPFFDLVVAVLVVGGSSQDEDERERVKSIYARYAGSEIVLGEGAVPLTVKVVLVSGIPLQESNTSRIPDEGLLHGDIFHVNAIESYEHLGTKTKALMAISAHLSFRFLAKTDSDTFPCLIRVLRLLTTLPIEEQPRVYAGQMMRCAAVFPEGHKWYDEAYSVATMHNTHCRPPFNQGSFYVLGRQIVDFLYMNRDLLTVMSVEDAMIGTWLLGVNKVILDLNAKPFHCVCSKDRPETDLTASFYHNYREQQQIDTCHRLLGVC